MTDEMPFYKTTMLTAKFLKNRIYLMIYWIKLIQSILLILSKKIDG